MKALRLILFVILGLFVLWTKYNGATSTLSSGTVHHSTDAGWQTNDSVPQKALDVLQTVRSTGHAPEGYEGGRVFQNREGRLPSDGDYREFDVDPHHGGRNAERIIVEWNTKKAWYTGDHYQTFTPLP